MWNSKKVLSMLLAAGMLLSCCACNKKDDVVEEKATAPVGSEPAAEVSEDAAAEVSTDAAVSVGTVSEAVAVSAEGWHCEELFHTKNAEPLRIPEEQEAADRETLNVYYTMPLELTEDWTIKGWFDQDVSIAIGNASDCSEDAREKTAYADAEYGDTWYFNISDPENYVHGLPERLMPDFIRISYMPRGSIIVNERECILINFCYYNEAGDAVSDAMGFTCFNGPDTTDGWNWEISIAE